jgi:16S rRNA (cytidine1402-2'-O)-methyltransferase
MKKKNIGSIYVISTPIGNSEDITIRAIKTLNEVDFIACEDTRITSKLCRMHNIIYKDKLIPYHDHNSERMAPFILNKLNNGFNIGVVTDAGTPLISDPGYKLIRTALEKKIEVKSVPGPSALTAAMSISGISSDQFIFMGFLPRKNALRKAKLSSLSNQNYSVVIFESALRLNKLLEEIYELLGNRNVSIIREITKLYEENIRGNIRNILNLLKNKKLKGEIVVLIEKPEASAIVFSDKDIIDMLKKKLPELGASRASKEISKITSIKSDYIYKLAISLKRSNA